VSAIRPARPEEAALLSALALRSKAVWGYDAAFLACCRAELTVTAEDIRERPAAVSCDGEHVLGFYLLTLKERSAEIDLFYVAPEALGRGIGRALLRHLHGEAAKRGAERLEVTADPHAEGFYARHGFARSGERPSGSIAGRMLTHLELHLGGGTS